jgi:hypothetical protein
VAAAVASSVGEVEPGQSAKWTYRIRNTGQIVDRLLIDVVGDAKGWATAAPNELNLFPGAEGEVTVTFAPPRSSSVRAGEVPFAVRIVSTEDTAGSIVEEGTLRVLPFDDIKAEAVPRNIRLRRRGATELAVDNAGNQPRAVQFFVEEPDEQLRVSVLPDGLMLEPGRATFSKVVVRPRRTFWKGPPKSLPFQISVVHEDRTGPPVYADAVVLQEQLLPSWLFKAIALAIAAAIALFILWQTLFKAQLRSAARDAVKPQVQAAAASANQAKKSAQQAQAAGGGGGGGGGGGAPPTTVPQAELGGIAGVLARGDATDFRVSAPANATPGSPLSAAVSGPATPAGKILLLTDLVFQNPNGDTGIIQVLKGDSVLFEIGLANFRDLDYHFVAPIEYKAGDAPKIKVRCDTTTSNGPCTASAYFAGVIGNPIS